MARTLPPARSRPARGRPAPADRRAFLLLTVMVLVFVATLMVGWGLNRVSMQSRIADLRIEDYRLHHERLGLIALSERWTRQESPESLLEEAQSSGAAYIATLPDDAEITIHVEDGQGLLPSRVDAATDSVVREFMLDALTLIPPGATALIRSVGPPQVSLHTAEDSVLHAVGGGDDKALAFMKDLQTKLPQDNQKLLLEINRAELGEVMTNRLSKLLTVEPTLWRLLADVRDSHGSRRYEILIEFRGNQAKAHSCRILPEADEQSPRDRGRRSRETTR